MTERGRDRVTEVLRELVDLRDPTGDPELEAVKAAILLEDSLGITLTDDDIGPALLGDHLMLAELVERRTGPS
jgi:hypothetical protein